MSKWGFGLSRKEILNSVQLYVQQNNLQTPFKDGKPGEDWFINFSKRNRLSIKKPELIEASRVRQQSDPFIVYDFFDQLKGIMDNLDLHQFPGKIWNADETAFNYDPSRTKVVTGIGEIAQRQTGGSGRKTTTVLACVNASGFIMPPMILHKGKRLWENMFGTDEYPETSYYVSENGWMTEQVFFLWFKNIFLKNCVERPALLIYDGHLSHISPELVTLALAEDVTILKLPPHTSAILQPLDVSVFKGLKSSWDALLTDWQRRNLGQQLTKSEFSNLLGKAWRSIKEPVVVNGFRKTGIFPLNRDSICKEKFDPEKLKRYYQEKNIADANTNEQTPTSDQIPTTAKASNSSTIESQIVSASTSIAESWEKVLLSAVKPSPKLEQRKRKRIDVAEVITTKTYLEHLKLTKTNKKLAKKVSKKQLESSSDDEELEQVVYAESDDSYEYPNDINENEVAPQVQEPTDDNIILGKYIVVRMKKRAVTHSIGVILQKNATKKVVIVRCLKRSTGNIFKLNVETEPLMFHYENIAGILGAPVSGDKETFIFCEDLSKFKNIY